MIILNDHWTIIICIVNGHKYWSPSILRYIFHVKPHFSKQIIVKTFLNGFWPFFAPEEAEIFKHYLFILAWFSVRLPLFSYDLKTIFFFWCDLLYILTKIKSEKSTWITRKQKPCRQKLLSDKKIKFKEFCVSWNKGVGVIRA